MMEMICIKGGGWKSAIDGKTFPGPKSDDLVNVIRSYTINVKGNPYTMYLLREFSFMGPSGHVLGYDARQFVPAGDISELTEILNVRQCDL